MKAKRISAWIIAVSLCMTNSGLVYAAENTGVEESSIQEVQEEDSIKEKKDEEPAAECVSENVQAEISNENELSGEITTETENVAENGNSNVEWSVDKANQNNASENKKEEVTGVYTDSNGIIWYYGFATEQSGPIQDYQLVVNPGEAELLYCDAQNAINKQIIEIPEYINGYRVIAVRNVVLEKNENAVEIRIPASMTHFIADTNPLFDDFPKLEKITVDKQNPYFYDIDGVLYGDFPDYNTALQSYTSFSGAGIYLIKYPEGREENNINLPAGVKEASFENLKNRYIRCPLTMDWCRLENISDSVILLCYTNLEHEFYGYMMPSFYGMDLVNCKIIVKNQEMKEMIQNQNRLENCINTNVLLESELSAEERNAYLTPATDVTFTDGSRTKNITLEPEENCTIDYQLVPEDTTDVVTWKSSDDSIAKVECVNGKVTVTGEANGECVITGTVHDQYTVNLNVKVKRAVTRIDIVYDGQVSPERIVSDTKDISPYPELRIYPYDAPYRENVTWESSNPSVISVEKSSYIEGAGNKYYSHQAYMHVHGPGEVTITAKYTDKETKQVVSRSIQLKLTRSIEENSVSSSDCGYNGASDANECQYTYNGSQIKPKINVTDLKYDTVLKEGTDYTVSYKNNVNPGIGEAIVKGIGNYTGKVVYEFTILKTSIRKATVKTETCQYNGKAQEPSVTVTLNGKTLKKGTDYTLSYNNNINPGTGEIIIKGKGGYTGKTVAYFEIQKKNSTTDSGKKTEKSGQKITGISSSYKKAYNSSFTLKPKAKGKLTYKSSNTKVATVNSKGKVKIKGTGKVTITITAKETSAYKKQTKKVTIYAVPGKRDIKKLSSGKKKLTVQWKKDNRSDGYQVQYSTDKKFKKNVKNVVIGKKQTTKQTIKKLKTGKKYYVRIRSYKKISGKKYYGTWSSKKTVKVK